MCIRDRDLRALALTYFTALQRTSDVESAACTYRDIALVLWRRRETSAVSKAHLQLEVRVSGVDVAEDEPEHYKPPPTEDDRT